MIPYPSFFNAFQEFNHLVQDEETTLLEARNLGELIVTSGKVIACDPYYCDWTKPFAISLPVGHYPVIVSIAHIHETDQRVALAAIILRDTAHIRWEVAAPSGEDVTYSYCVDSGIGCFMDADAANAFVPICQDYDEDKDPLLADMMKHYVHTWGWTNLCISKSTDANIVAFSSGWGDGGYPSYSGYDEHNNIVCLITEFGVLEKTS